jgi:beta-xylosidase
MLARPGSDAAAEAPAGMLQDIEYAAMVARSRSATGPFETLAQATGAADSAALRRSEAWIGPGHNPVVTDRAGQDGPSVLRKRAEGEGREGTKGRDSLLRPATR